MAINMTAVIAGVMRSQPKYSEEVKEEMKLANNVLNAVSWLNPSAIIAGGAPRNWKNNELANDIDIFIHYNWAAPSHVKWFLNKTYKEEIIEWSETKWGDKIPDHYKKNTDLLCVHECTIKNKKFQIMVLKTETYSLLERHFPVGSSMYWYKNGYISNDSWSYYFEDYKIQVVHDDYYAELRTNPYMQKVMEKFPEKEGYLYISRSAIHNFQQQLGLYSGMRMRKVLEALKETNEEIKVIYEQNKPKVTSKQSETETTARDFSL